MPAVRLDSLKKPEFFYQPRLLAKRLLPGLFASDTAPRIRLPWNLSIHVDVEDQIVHGIRSLGLHELVVCEVIWRLLEETEVGIDIGAHVGHMTSLMAARLAPAGTVHALEPHPRLAALLRQSAASWRGVEIHEAAASNLAGRRVLVPPAPYHENSGTSHLGAEGAPTGVAVDAVTLDGLLGSFDRRALLKIDAEGHETEVLQGAASLLERRRIRDIVFEDHSPHPSDAMQLLERSGYRLFQLARGFTRPRLVPAPPGCKAPPWEAINYLATLEPDRAHRLLARRGWQVFGGRRDT